jgi:predicted AAA+ superfamily ATPase
MIKRILQDKIEVSLKTFPAVGIVGPRQSGKTTLAHAIGNKWKQGAVFLDLERPSDLGKLDEAELYLAQYKDKLVVIDEVQRKPDLFPLLRSLIDEHRTNGRFLLLGSASPELKRQGAESLAGRIVYHQLSPFIFKEVGTSSQILRMLWVKGGFPLSFLEKSNEKSFLWREAFISTYLERDIGQFGFRIPSAVLHRFWQMLSHLHGQLWNASHIGASLGVSPPTARHYLDILHETFMVRQLQPYFANVKKRLVKSPKVYLCDSGILHTLLRIGSYEDLLNHPAAGHSFEGWVVEQIMTVMPLGCEAFFYRTSSGAEIDLVLLPPNKKPVAIEIKFSQNPGVSKGFWEAFADLKCGKGFIVYPGKEYYALRPDVFALPVNELARILQVIYKQG